MSGVGNYGANEAVRRRVGELRAAGLTYALIGRRLGLSERQVAGTLRGEPPAAALPCRVCGAGVGPAHGARVAPRPPLCLACLAGASGAGLPDRLLSLRLASGLTQAELARRAGLRRSTITRYESGRSEPRPAQLAALASVLGHGLLADQQKTLEAACYSWSRQGVGR